MVELDQQNFGYDLSIVIPIYNEEENIEILSDEIIKVLTNFRFELIFVNDGSTDNSLPILKKMADTKVFTKNSRIVVLNLRRNSGQTAAMRAGFDHANGEYVVSMDGDGQNDPADILKLHEEILKGEVDVICGWRKHRKDPLSKKIPSKLSNFLHKRLTGLKINDSGCTLRIYIQDAVKDLPIHGEDHRFLPQIIYARGFKVVEMVVNHRERTAGESKYGFTRLWRGYLDLLSTTFVNKIGIKPFQFFSKIALLPGIIGSAILIYLVYIRLAWGEPIADRPILLLGILLEIFAIQFFVTGLTAEVISTANASGQKRYSIRDIHLKSE